MSDQPKEKSPQPTSAPEASTSSTTATPAVAPAQTTSSPPPAPAQDVLEVADDFEDDDVRDDGDSALGSDAASSTASVTASILEYRHIQGRTFNSDRHPTEYFIPNDDQQLESIDITHHYLTVLLDGQLFLAPIKKDVQRVVDIGTGTGIWAIDFADQYPNAEVIGSDLSPTQPQWVPPNVRFEIDDATLDWTWKDNFFDFIHIRYLFGAIKDWNSLFREAYRTCAPGGWVESVECDCEFRSDDGTTDSEAVLKTWTQLFKEGGAKTERDLFIMQKNVQEKAIEAAGFINQTVLDFKIPVGGWPKDPKLAEVGNYVKLTMENDLEGYTLFLWHNILSWPKDDYQLFLMGIRNVMRNRKVHGYMKVRVVYAQKPE